MTHHAWLAGPRGAPIVRKLALCLHDLRVSGGPETAGAIAAVLERFGPPLTVHLVFDQPLLPDTPLYAFLRRLLDQECLELVFHGLSHRCPAGTGRWLALFHKQQAEYLQDDAALRRATELAFARLAGLLGAAPGLCPPCWMASGANWRFFDSLGPRYVESLLGLHGDGQRVFSPVISLASPVAAELVFLRLAARGMYALSRMLPAPRVRMAIHVGDLELRRSMELFAVLHGKLLRRGFQGVLQRQLLS